MRINVAKQKMMSGQPAFGYLLSAGSSVAAEIVGASGIDFVMIDTQHGSWGPDSTICALTALTDSRASVFARPAFNNYTLIGRLLDEGALGIVIPMVDTAVQAKAAADACRFPWPGTLGTRSWGWGRARAYGSDYTDWINQELFVAVQIESVEAVQNAEAILATPGVDGCWVGAGDLSFTMGISPREYSKSDIFEEHMGRVLAACQNTGKVPGFASLTPKEAIFRANQGFRFLTVGIDTELLAQGASAGVAALQDWRSQN